MGSHLINLAFRFLLELAAISAMGFWGWKLSDTNFKWLWMIAVPPLFFLIIWGIFNVPGDPSRSGNAPIVVAGYLRLGIEVLFFAFALWALTELNLTTYGLIFLILLVIHYVLSHDRMIWLLKQN
jgi:hypothetical protein